MITDDNSGLVASNNEDDEEGKLLGEELGEHAKKQLMGIMDTAASIVKITDDSGIRGIINMVTDGNHTQLSGWMDNQTLQTLSRDFINPNGLGRNKDS
ncbi:hypothetical protein TGAMA5MH_11096 [Trichoderma gamsii]|nr:hypothetical protein TGAMA5MH_11096 [Trichoderma gamsii]